MTIPRLSVIVVCINKPSVLHECLSALVPQLAPGEIELLAIGRWDDRRDRAMLQAQYGDVSWISAPSDFTVPQMRASAMSRARGDIVALLEDDCVVGDTWCREIICAHEAPFDAIGGPIEPAPDYQARDWAVYFCEYGRFMSPFSGIVSALPGNNVSYKRAVLDCVKDDAGFYDVFFHGLLQQSGKELFSDSRLAVSNVNHWSPAHLTTIPFHHGRAFAAMRVAGFPRWRRWLYAMLTCGLPAMKLERIARDAIRRRNVTCLARSLHLVSLFVLSWSLGELSGYLAGAGDSRSRWR